jgi:hypothetical protein
LIDANIGAEALVHIQVAVAGYFANGQHHTLKRPTQALSHLCIFQAQQALGDHIDFGNLLVPQPNAGAVPE